MNVSRFLPSHKSLHNTGDIIKTKQFIALNCGFNWVEIHRKMQYERKNKEQMHTCKYNMS